MGQVTLEGLRDGAWLLVDTAPIIYTLEDNPRFAPRFRSVFEAHDAGSVRFAVSAVTIAEVMTGPLKAGDEALTGGVEDDVAVYQTGKSAKRLFYTQDYQDGRVARRALLTVFFFSEVTLL